MMQFKEKWEVYIINQKQLLWEIRIIIIIVMRWNKMKKKKEGGGERRESGKQ